MCKALVRSLSIAALTLTAGPVLAHSYPWSAPRAYYHRVYVGPSLPFGYPGWSYGASIEQTPRLVRVRSVPCKARGWRSVRRCY